MALLFSISRNVNEAPAKATLSLENSTCSFHQIIADSQQQTRPLGSRDHGDPPYAVSCYPTAIRLITRREGCKSWEN